MTERYVHAAQVAFPGAAERSEERLYSVLFRAVRLIGLVAIVLVIAFGVLIVVSPTHDLQCNGTKRGRARRSWEGLPLLHRPVNARVLTGLHRL
jgi:hypothetical protein